MVIDDAWQNENLVVCVLFFFLYDLYRDSKSDLRIGVIP